MATWNDVRALAAGLADVEASTTYRKPALKVRGRAFAWMSPHAPALALNCDPEERPLMVAANPDVYHSTAHYDGYPSIVLVRLENVTDLDELRERIEESWKLAATHRDARVVPVEEPPR